MSLRSDFAAALKPLLPASIKIIDIPKSLDGLEPNKPVVMLYREQMTKAVNAQGNYLNQFAVWIVTPYVDPARSEDSLDTVLDQVIEAIDDITWMNWSVAERSTFGDQQAPAYKITVTVISNK
jgi:hypothetical protein